MDQAEQLRIIKANNQIRPTARVITVTSGKGGVGKSNMSINLAIQFRKMGKRVIILDADFGLANIEIMFGAIPKHNLCDLVYEGKSISDIITWGPMEVGFISGGQRGSAAGDHTGAYFHHGFLFSAEGTVQTSEIPGGFHEGDDGGQPGK